MEKYSVKENIYLMSQSYYKPNSVISSLIAKSNKIVLFYSLIPLIIFTFSYEILNIISFIYKTPLLPLPKIIPLNVAKLVVKVNDGFSTSPSP